MAEESTKKLHACLDKETMDVFFASVVDRQGVNISLRSSTSLKKGKQLAMMPVPEDWDGQAIQAEEIQKSQTSFDVMVNRLEGRGAFQARMISSDERNLLDRYRSGRGNYASLDVETSSAGMVTTIKLQGIINLDTAAQIQAIIRRVGQHQTLILLDLTHLVSITRSSVGMLTMLLKEEVHNQRKVALLLEENSDPREVLMDSKISEIVSLHIDRDEAVATLLRQTLD